MVEAIGTKLRRQRRRLGLTLDELAGRTGISKPYLSLIETGRVPNPPSDEKLRKLEQTLAFTPGELVTQAHLQRTPKDVRAMLERLMKAEGAKAAANGAKHKNGSGHVLTSAATHDRVTTSRSQIDLDGAELSGVLQELVDGAEGNVETVTTNAVPVINRVSAGYPKDFTDLSYPRGVADEYINCSGLTDRDAFGARVFGDSMTPKYREGDIVIFSPSLPTREGDDCFVRFKDGQTTFKRVFFESGENGTSILRLQPRNERYRPQIVPSDNVTGLYRAVYRYQRVDED